MYDLANWMRDLFPYIRARSIWNVAIPGTHGSGVFSADNTIGVRNQRQTIAEQLAGGVRALDVRVTYSSYKSDYYLAHANIWANSQKFFPAIREIRDFVASHRGEIVIVKLSYDSGDNGLTPERRRYVLQQVRDIFGTLLMPYGTQPTDDYLVQDIVRDDRRAIVLTDLAERGEHMNYFWPLDDPQALHDTWSGTIDDGWVTIKRKVTLLRNHLTSVEYPRRGTYKRFFWVSFNLWTINVRDSAGSYQHPFAAEFLTTCKDPNFLRRSNIFGIDFYDVSDFVHRVIALNTLDR